MSEKQCIKCGGIKPLSAYTTARSTVDKLNPTCKSCKKSYDKARMDRLRKDAEWVESERARMRNGYAEKGWVRGNNPEKKNAHAKKYNAKYPEKKRAVAAAGKLMRPTGYERHHWSYNEKHWQDIIFLTPKEHNTVHRFLEYCTETFYYKTLDGVLLDTREKHENYILSLEVEV